MRRPAALHIILAVTIFLLPAHADTSDDDRGRWPATRCSDEDRDRPTILTAFFQGKTDKASWRYNEARDALEDAGVPTKVLERNGRRLWDGFAQAGGVARRLVPAGRRLRNYDPPRRRLSRPQVYFECSGREGNLPRFFIQIPADIHARQVVNDHGGREKVIDRVFRYEGTRWWVLRRRPHSGTVQRMLIYLRDRRVFTVEMEHYRTVDTD